MKTTIASSCEYSPMLNIYIINVERNSSYSLNVIISLGPITCFHFVNIMLYMWKVIITNTNISDWGWSINGSHKWSANSNLHAFFGWTATKNFYSFDKFR